MHNISEIRTDIVNVQVRLSVLYFKSQPTGGFKDTVTEKRCEGSNSMLGFIMLFPL